jgi:hypothetical protein
MTSMWRKIGLAVLAGTPFVLGGCNGADVYFDAPILEAAGINLNVKKNDEEDVPKRAGIVIPPSTDKLPEPGTRTAAAGEQNWPQDPDKLKKNKEEQEAAAHEKYCREGDWAERPASPSSTRISALRRVARPDWAKPSASRLAAAPRPRRNRPNCWPRAAVLQAFRRIPPQVPI